MSGLREQTDVVGPYVEVSQHCCIDDASQGPHVADVWCILATCW